jgi:hypothetical protein
MSTNANFGWDPTTQKISDVDFVQNVHQMPTAPGAMLHVLFGWCSGKLCKPHHLLRMCMLRLANGLLMLPDELAACIVYKNINLHSSHWMLRLCQNHPSILP